MANPGIGLEIDLSSALKGLDALDSPELKSSLLRSMLVAGGQVYRDGAKARVSVVSGLLRSAIYLAHKPGKSTGDIEVYSVTWNSKKAPHGHLVEFPHWQKYKVVKKGDEWFTTNQLRDDGPLLVAAKPFLRPTFEGESGLAQKAMIERGRARLPELLAEISSK